METATEHQCQSTLAIIVESRVQHDRHPLFVRLRRHRPSVPNLVQTLLRHPVKGAFGMVKIADTHIQGHRSVLIHIQVNPTAGVEPHGVYPASRAIFRHRVEYLCPGVFVCPVERLIGAGCTAQGIRLNSQRCVMLVGGSAESALHGQTGVAVMYGTHRNSICF